MFRHAKYIWLINLELNTSVRTAALGPESDPTKKKKKKVNPTLATGKDLPSEARKAESKQTAVSFKWCSLV